MAINHEAKIVVYEFHPAADFVGVDILSSRRSIKIVLSDDVGELPPSLTLILRYQLAIILTNILSLLDSFTSK